jgi:hypothetical protein
LITAAARAIPFVIVGLAAAGCLPAAPELIVTAFPTEWLPTSIALTVLAQTTPGTPTPAAEGTLPTATPRAPTITPTSPLAEAIPTSTPIPTVKAVTPTHTPAPDIPAAEIEITAPGALSKVISPIPVRALLVPGDQGRVTVELLGEDGRVLTREIIVLNPDLGRKAGLVLDLTYEIPFEVELGRLVIYRQDEAGRTTALSSIELVLLTSGQPDYNPVLDRLAVVILQEPLSESIVQGGVVVVSGLARTSTGAPLVAELIAETGQIVGQRVFDVPGEAAAEHTPFTVEIPYTVDEPTWVLLIVREGGERIPGIVYLISTEVLLSP